MKEPLLIIIILAFAGMARSQSIKHDSTTVKQSLPSKVDSAKSQDPTQDKSPLNQSVQPAESTEPQNSLNQVFSAVEQEPSFPGGQDKLNKFIRRKVAQLQDGDYNGKVTVNFVVEKDGHLSNFQIFRGSDKKSNDMAITIVSDSPKWNPGMQNGHLVRVEYSVIVAF